jgi:hypothetical protein
MFNQLLETLKGMYLRSDLVMITCESYLIYYNFLQAINIYIKNNNLL